ncbi:MAG TPA: protease pro-enzyme activation domain-containing protein, partial [Sphingomonadales bacterium]|nr:protease pro-enzyme activation domain-containing protein [Sphingomonadales bacterium]
MKKARAILLPGTLRSPWHGARAGARVHPDHPVEVTLRLRPRDAEIFAAAERCGYLRPVRKHHLTPEQFEDRFGAHDRDVEKVTSFAGVHGLRVEHLDKRRRSVVLAGTNEAMSRVFRVERRHFHHRRGSYHGHTGAVHVPAGLAAIVQGVFGLDQRPQAKRQA